MRMFFSRNENGKSKSFLILYTGIYYTIKMNDFQVIFLKFERNRQKKRKSVKKEKEAKKTSVFDAGLID